MITNKERFIFPLKKESFSKVPWFLRWFGWLNNRWHESAVNTILAKRNLPLVMESWETVFSNTDLVEHILLTIGKEIGWKNPHFIPQDECFIVMKLWWHGVADCWERERCMWAIEKICGKGPPSSILPTVINMTFGEFLGSFQENQTALAPRSLAEGED